MVMSARPAAGVAMLVVMLAASPARTLAQTFERPPTFDVAKIKGLQPSGDNYTINNPVRSDGLLRLYTLTTPYGEFMPQGDQMLRMRVNELLALHELEKISSSESYGKALVDAGLSPFKYTGKLIINPAKTVGDTFSGIGTMFGRITSDVANVGKTPGDPLAGLLGVTDQRRKIATKVGVDPYTDFPPLDAKLSSLSQAAAAGGLTVSAAMLAVPVGFAGIVFSNLSTASTLEGVRIDELARDQTAAQIFDINREKLRAMGADIDLTEALLVNRSYTPIDMAVIVAALDSLVGVEDREVFLRRVVQVEQRPHCVLHAPPCGNACRVPKTRRGLRPFCLAWRLSVQCHARRAHRRELCRSTPWPGPRRRHRYCATAPATREGSGNPAGSNCISVEPRRRSPKRSFRRWAGRSWKTPNFDVRMMVVAGGFRGLLYAE